jgi:hypothetical protein
MHANNNLARNNATSRYVAIYRPKYSLEEANHARHEVPSARYLPMSLEILPRTVLISISAREARITLQEVQQLSKASNTLQYLRRL